MSKTIPSDNALQIILELLYITISQSLTITVPMVIITTSFNSLSMAVCKQVIRGYLAALD